MSHWANKVILITGAGSGIGKALAQHFARLNARLILADINEEQLNITAADVGSQLVMAKSMDVSQKAQWLELADEVRNKVGYLDVVINNAGVLASDYIEAMPEDQFDWVLNINLYGVIHGTRLMLPLVEQSQRGMIVNLSSIFGLIGVAKMGAYNTSKFAVRGFTEALRQDFILNGKGIDVVCVHPGGIKTNIANNSRSTHSDVARMANHFSNHALTTPAKAAMIIERGMRKRKKRILVGPDAILVDWLHRWFPNHYYKAFNRLFIPKALFGSDNRTRMAAGAKLKQQ